MTDPTEDQMLADLDQRAATAVRALDDAVQRVPMIDFETPSRERRPRWVSPVSIAAGLLVVALIAAALVFTGGDEENTLAGDVDFTNLVFPDPEAIGFRINVAFDGTETPVGGEQFLALPVTVQGPSGDDDPWGGAVVSYALPGDSTTLGGEAVDIGGPEAFYEDAGTGHTVGWADGDQVRYLVSTRVERDALVRIAADAVATGGDATTAISGQQVVFTGSAGDVFPTLLTTLGRGGVPAEDRTSGVFYGAPDGEADRGIAIATSRGSDVSMRAASALATSVREITVRGHAALTGEFFGDDELGLLHVSWLEDDDTLVRVDAIGVDAAELFDLLDRLDPVDDATFAQLVRDHPIEDAGAPAQVPEDAGTSLASVATGLGETSARATLYDQQDGMLAIEISTEGAGGATGSGFTVASVSTNVAVRDLARLDHGPIQGVLIAGVVGPGASEIAVVDADTGERITETDPEAIGPLTASIEGSENVLFLAAIGPQYEERRLQVVAILADGSVVELPT